MLRLILYVRFRPSDEFYSGMKHLVRARQFHGNSHLWSSLLSNRALITGAISRYTRTRARPHSRRCLARISTLIATDNRTKLTTTVSIHTSVHARVRVCICALPDSQKGWTLSSRDATGRKSNDVLRQNVASAPRKKPPSLRTTFPIGIAPPFPADGIHRPSYSSHPDQSPPPFLPLTPRYSSSESLWFSQLF